MMNRVSKTPVVNRQNINNSHVCYSTIREMDGKVVHYGVVSKREYFYHKQLMEERMARTKYISSEHRTRSQFMAENRTSEELRASKIYHAAGESSEKTAYLSGERNVVAVSSSYSRKRVERGGIVRFGRRLVTTTTYEEEVEKIISFNYGGDGGL